MTISVSGRALRVLGLALGCITATSASATNRYYDCTTGNLLTATCWSGNVRPGVNDAAFIGDTGYGFDVTATLSAATPAFTPQLEYIAYAGHNGTVNQSAGTNGSPTATYQISVGYGAGLTGTYNLSGTGTLNAGNTLEVGANGTGIFNQTGGTSIVPTYLYLGTNPTGNGSYNLQGGTLDADSTMVSTQEIIGFYGTGSFTQTGGTHNANTISMATGAGSVGSYSLSGTGTLTAAIWFSGVRARSAMLPPLYLQAPRCCRLRQPGLILALWSRELVERKRRAATRLVPRRASAELSVLTVHSAPSPAAFAPTLRNHEVESFSIPSSVWNPLRCTAIQFSDKPIQLSKL